MKIAYFLHLNYSEESGIYRKISQQVAHWCSLGHEVSIFIVSGRLHDINTLQRDFKSAKVILAPYSLQGSRLRSARERMIALNEIYRSIQAAAPDLVYMRQGLVYPGMGSFVKSLKTVLEVNTDDLEEMRVLSYTRYLWHLFTRGRVLNQAAGAVFVTDELRNRRHFRVLKMKSCVVANGFDLNSVSDGGMVSQSKQISIVFLGSSGMPWHGVDKLRTLALAEPKLQFDIVGFQASEFSSPFPGNVQFHGALSRVDYEPLLRKATVGIGTLALHRKQMDEACALKTREYLAYGLPVILGYRDTDFPKSYDFICQLENTEDNVATNLIKISTFIKMWIGKKIPRDRIMHLDSSTKESARIGFFKEIVKNP